MDLSSDFQELLASRLERAADRMSNCGFSDEERRYRRAAASVRNGLSLQETKEIESTMLLNPRPVALHRLSALAAAGEYDDTGSDGVDLGFVSASEGGQVLSATVPDAGASNSGVTIATGVDLGQLSTEQLDALDLPQDLKDQLTQYIGLTGQDAVDYLAEHPLTIDENSAESLDRAVLDPIIDRIQTNFDATSPSVEFSNLPPEAQTVLADLAVQYGNLSTRTPEFWGLVTSGDWTGAVDELRDFGDRYATRRGREADLLQQAIDRGAFSTPAPSPTPTPTPPKIVIP